MQKDKQNLSPGQIFTPAKVANDMLDMVDFCKHENYYLEPTCGDGSILEPMIDRIYKALINLHNGDPLKAFADLLFKFEAWELDPELVRRCRVRIYTNLMFKLEKLTDTDTVLRYLIARQIADKIKNTDFFEQIKKL